MSSRNPGEPCHISDMGDDDFDGYRPFPWQPEQSYEELRQHEIDAKIAPMKPLTGWSSDYYELPEGATGLQDLIEFKNMNFAVGNVFKAIYRLGEKQGTTELYDIDKVLWYAQREKVRLLKLEEEKLDETVQSNAHGPASSDYRID